MVTQACSIAWQGHLPTVSTERLTLRPIQDSDLKSYQALFASSLTMKHYIRNTRTPDQTAARFHGWQERWKVHPFSALAIFRKTIDNHNRDFVGHAILGHGDYEGNPESGFSEAAIILTPSYWNADFADKSENEETGRAGLKGVGTEVRDALKILANELVEKRIDVPVDVTAEQQEEVRHHLESGKIKKCIRDPKTDAISSVFVPFTEVRVTCSKQNRAMVKMLHYFVDRGFGTLVKRGDETREMMAFPLNRV